MKFIALFLTAILLSSCSTKNEIITADETMVVINPRNDVIQEESRVKAAVPTAEEHCAKYGKSAMFVKADKSNGRYSAITFRCQ